MFLLSKGLVGGVIMGILNLVTKLDRSVGSLRTSYLWLATQVGTASGTEPLKLTYNSYC